MGMGRRAMVYLGLAEEDEGYVDDDYEADEPVREAGGCTPGSPGRAARGPGGA